MSAGISSLGAQANYWDAVRILDLACTPQKLIWSFFLKIHNFNIIFIETMGVSLLRLIGEKLDLTNR